MQTLERASPPRNSEIHLTTFRELERHCADEAKQAGYRRLLADFGIDAGSFAALATHPRLVLAEQPGSWFCADDLMRFRLLSTLIETFDFHESSGVLSLAEDAFTCRGLKRIVLLFRFHRRFAPVHLVGAAFSRRHRNRVYAALPIAGTTRERLATIFDLSLAMLESARAGPEVFAEEVLGIFRGGVRSGLRPLLPPGTDRRSLRVLGRELHGHDLEAAMAPLREARRELGNAVPWVAYWDRVNETFMGTRIGKLGPLFNRLLLTVDDPIRMSRSLLRHSRHRESEPVAVAAIIAHHEKYRMVFFDSGTNRFFYVPRAGVRRAITWSRIRELAREGRTGGPSGTLEYLLMAASGIYLVVDPRDGRNRFERQARRIHEHYTGLPFPYVALADHGREKTNDYLQMFAAGFEGESRDAIEKFFE